MKLPNLEHAVVAPEKITEYLLSTSHPHGRHKAAFFRRFGFTDSNWPFLAAALRQHAGEHDVTGIEPSPFGTRYVIDGTIETPDGRDPTIRSIWFVESDDDRPRLVTAYPAPQE